MCINLRMTIMKRKTVFNLIACAATLSVVGGLAFIVANHDSFGTIQVKAGTEKSITWDKNTSVTAATAGGNDITLGSRYLNDWTFGGDYFASSSSTNSFIDNFTNGSFPFRKISSFTLVYTYDDEPLRFEAFPNEGYTFSHIRATVDAVVSGKKYEVGTGDFEYINCNAEDTFRWFCIQSAKGNVNITSFTIEYICD